MVKTETRYICEVCDKEGSDKSDIEKHESVPLSGLDLTIGHMFKNISRSDNNYLCFEIVSQKEIQEDHFCLYRGKPYSISLNNAQNTIHAQDPAHCLVSLNIAKREHISELTDEEYKLALAKLERVHITDLPMPISKVSKGVLKEY